MPKWPEYTQPTFEEWFAAATAAAQDHGYSTAQVMAHGKPRTISVARWQAWRALLDANPKHSIAGVARASGFDHTSVLYGLKRLSGASQQETRRTKATGRWPLPTVGVA